MMTHIRGLKHKSVTEQCMFCPTRIVVLAPNKYAVICATCRQQAFKTAERFRSPV